MERSDYGSALYWEHSGLAIDEPTRWAKTQPLNTGATVLRSAEQLTRAGQFPLSDVLGQLFYFIFST